MGEAAKVTLFLFKSGVLPDATQPRVARGSRLRVDLSALCEQTRRPVPDAVTAILMHVACATSEHEEHVHGIEMCFSGDEVQSCTIWFGAALADDDDAVADLREEVCEALNVSAELGTESQLLRLLPFDARSPLAGRCETRVLEPVSYTHLTLPTICSV